MSVLGLELGYTMKHGLSPRKFPWAAPSGTSLGSGHIPRLVLIQIQSESHGQPLAGGREKKL